MMRVRAYVDGYNLYHAVSRFGRNHLKWLDLWKLSQVFVPPQTAKLAGVHYFSAYANWRPESKKRHETYVSALRACGVTIHLAHFKLKDRRCPECRHRYTGHEEKETDVDLALTLFDHARRDMFDRALLITRDSDLVPAVRLTKQAFPEKDIRIVAPPHLGHSTEMLNFADGKHKIQRKHLDCCLLPARLTAADGTVIVRPIPYDPPGL